MKKRARLMLILAMLIFGSISIFRKNVALSSSEIAMFRGFLGDGGLWLFRRLTGHSIDYAAIKAHFGKLSTMGMLIGLNWVLLFEAYQYTTVGIATLFYYLSPIIIILLSPLILKEKLTPWKGLCTAIAFLGMVGVSGVLESGAELGSRPWLGILLAVGGAVLYAFIVLITKTVQGVPPYETTITEMAFAGLIMVPYTLMTGGFSLPGDGRSILMLLIMCVVHTGAAYALYFAALKALPAQTVSLYSYIDPASAILFAFLFLGEKMTVLQLVGGVILIGAAMLSETGPGLLKRGNPSSDEPVSGE